MAGRYLPNVLVTLQLAALSMLVDLVFGFPFAYILVRKVRYRDLVRAFMVFPMFGALYIAFGMRFILLPGGPATPLLEVPSASRTRSVALQPAVGRVRHVDLHVPVHGHEHRHGAEQCGPDAGGGRRLPGRAPVADVRRACCCRSPARASSPAPSWSSAGISGPLPSRCCWARINEQKSLAWTLYQRGVVQTDYGLSTAMGVVLLVLAFAVTYFSLRYSRGALVE